MSHDTSAAMMPVARPLPVPTRISFINALRELLHVSSPSAMPRTITASVCVAALPPIPATIGMNTASATHALMVF